MNKQSLLLTLTLLVLLTPRAFGQGGCDDSPENPTLILAGLAGGAYAVSALRTRLRAARSAKNQR
jgi:XrtJ-associated TM-motif-TM protein